MAPLWSALPSPRKQKGEKLKQELGVKAGALFRRVYGEGLGNKQQQQQQQQQPPELVQGMWVELWGLG
jgi:hypothetical protein